MASDIKQDDFFFSDQQGQRNAIRIRQPDGMTSCKLTGKRMKTEARLKGIFLQSLKDRSEAGPKVRMLFEELICLTKKLF